MRYLVLRMRTFLVASVLGSLALGCGAPSSTPITPAAPAVPAAKLGDGAPLVTPGERMTYRVVLGGVELAAMSLGIGERTELAGNPTILVQGHARSVGLANMIAAIDDTFTSWLDVDTGRSLRFVVDEYETNSKVNIEHTIADLANKTAELLPITFALNDAPPQPEPQKLRDPDVWDYNAFLVALRSWEGPVGTTQSVEVLRSRWLWRVDMKIRSKERLTTELGDLPALRFDGHTYKVDRQGAKDPKSDERDFSIWISDDDGRVPLLIVARTDYGDVRMEIVDYQPGTGQRLRP
ncbi:MAG: hypothetical protein JWP01_2153 [Myxococcales bacterium]|nr:hypothetical protein [Myxococcales bacterium]